MTFTRRPCSYGVPVIVQPPRSKPLFASRSPAKVEGGIMVKLSDAVSSSRRKSRKVSQSTV